MTLEAMIRRLQNAGYKVVKRGVLGRAIVPTKCRKCGVLCPTAREARAHCAKPRTGGK